MPQSSREIVQAAIRFESPERLPVKMASLGVDDTAWIPRKAHESRDEYGLVVDEWGCRWEHSDTWNMGQVKGHPLSSLSEYDTIQIPDFFQTGMYVIIGGGVIHFLSIAVLGRIPRFMGFGLLGAYAFFLFKGIIQ